MVVVGEGHWASTVRQLQPSDSSTGRSVASRQQDVERDADDVVHVERTSPAASGSSCSSGSEPPVNDGNDTSAKEKVEQQQSPQTSATDGKSSSWSAGSAMHSSGQCKPCAWYWKPSGCALGANCVRCHLCGDNAFLAFRKDRLAGLKSNRERKKNRRRSSQR